MDTVSLERQLNRIQFLAEHGRDGQLVEYLAPACPPRVRQAALDALCTLDTDSTCTAIAPLLREEAGPLTERALAYLEGRAGDAALRALANGLSAHDPFQRLAAVQVLARRDEPSVFTYLVRACRDPEKSIRDLAGRLLERRVRSHEAQLPALREEALAGVLAELPFAEVWRFVPRATHEALRHAAISQMARFASEQARNFLISLAMEAAPPSCDLALEAIAQNPAITADMLRPLVDWGRDELHDRAFALYAERAGPEGVELLTSKLTHPSAATRQHAVENLFRLFGAQIIPVILPLLQDQDPIVCGAALDALQEGQRALVEPSLIAAATRGATAVRPRALALAAAKGICAPELLVPYLDAIAAILKDPRPEGEALDRVCDMIAVLAPLQPVALLVPLVRAARSPSPRLRRVAMEAFTHFPLDHRVEAFAYLQEASDAHVLTEVAFTLDEADRPEATIPLVRVAMGRHRKNAREAHKRLNRRPEIRDIERLCELVRNPLPVVKQFAIDRLKEMGDPRAVAMLLQAMDEGNEQMQQLALQRLAELGNRTAQEMAAEGLDRTTAAFEREDLEAMQQQADPRAIDMLLQAAEDEDEMVQLSAVEALGEYVEDPRVAERLIQFIGYGAVPVRQKAVEILGQHKVQAAVDPLIGALGNIFLRSYAEEALRLIGDRRAYLAIVRRRRREKMFPSRAQQEREKLKQKRAKRISV